MKNYTLTKETKGKKFIYHVFDAQGNEVANRTSTRDYVACTINGEMFFGRLDLIGKGEHGKALSVIENNKNTTLKKYKEILANKKEEIHRCNAMHLATYKKYSTPEQLNAPLDRWMKPHLVEFYGQAVADSVNTQCEFQVATCNDEHDYNSFLERTGSYEEWKAKREAYVAIREKEMQVAYLVK